jgi:hypothetical protein
LNWSTSDLVGTIWTPSSLFKNSPLNYAFELNLALFISESLTLRFENISS